MLNSDRVSIATERPHQGEDNFQRRAQAELRQSAYPELRRIRCELHNGVLTLQGRVPSFYHKQVAQSLIGRWLEGLAVIDNQLEVA